MRKPIVVGFLSAALGLVACGSSSDSTFDVNGGGGNGSGGNLGGGNGTGDLGGAGSGGGGGDPSCAATVASAQAADVDIIFVIDTSGSMTEEIVQTQQNINNFAQTIGSSGLSYQVIMIGTRGTSGNAICVPPPLGGPACADNPPKFHHVDTRVGSTNSLSLILSTYDNATIGWNKYLRQNAYKVFIEITDDNSNLAYTSFDQQLLAKQPAGMFGDANNRKYIFDSICGWQDGTPVLSNTKCNTAVNIGAQYQNLSQLTKGIVDSVCKTSYAGVFNNIAKGVVAKLGCEYQVPQSSGQPADPTKVVVQYTPGGKSAQKLTQVTDASKCGQVTDGWYYDDNANPTKITLCPSMCTTVGADAGGKMEVLLGCKAPPPR